MPNGRDGGQQFRVYTAAWPGNPGGLVRTSRAANADDGALRNAALLLAGLTVAAAGVTYGAARLTAGRILRPIAELTAAAEHVTQTRDLTARLGSTGTSDEVGRLGSSFDTMLAALHESVTAQRQLVADASHELRTPLTSLTTNLDLLEDGAGLADPQAPALVRAAREQAGELDQLITDLLDLARYHESAPHRETVRLDLLTDEAVRRVRQRVPHAGHRYPSCIRAWCMSTPLLSITPSATWSTTPSNGRRPTPRCAWSSRTARCRSPITARASPTRTSPTSSNASTGHPPHEACQAQDSD